MSNRYLDLSNAQLAKKLKDYSQERKGDISDLTLAASVRITNLTTPQESTGNGKNIAMQDAINDLKMSLRMWGRKPQKESYEMAIRSLEAWDRIGNDIVETLKMCLHAVCVLDEERIASRGMMMGLHEAAQAIEAHFPESGIEEKWNKVLSPFGEYGNQHDGKDKEAGCG